MGPISWPQCKHDNKKSVITIDILKEQNQDAKGSLKSSRR